MRKGRVFKPLSGIVCFCLLILFTACVSPPPRQKYVKPGPPSNEEVVQKGKALLELPVIVEFLDYINKNKKEYPEACRELLANYAAKLEKLIKYYREQKDFFKVRYYFNNLRIVQNINPEAVTQFNQELASAFRSQHLSGMEKYFSLQYPEIKAPATFQPLKNLNNFNELLAIIQVEIIYKTDFGLTRRFVPFGSGVLINSRQVLTAYHVIEDIFYKNVEKYNIIVKIGETTMEQASVMAWDSLTDLAVIKLPEDMPMPYEFHTLLGDSNSLKQGFSVYCLGHPRGYFATLTRGIISSTKRKAPEVGDWLQTDAFVTGGASGGLLIGEDNLIYGIIDAGHFYEDINFVIPSNLVLSVLDNLKSGNTIRRPWLGLLLQEDEFATSEQKGQVSIRYVFPSSPLSASHIQEDDFLVSINDQQITSIEQAQRIINELETGNIVKLQYKSNEIKLGVNSKGETTASKDSGTGEQYVQLARRPDDAIYNATRDFNQLSSLYPYFGFDIDQKDIIKEKAFINGKNYAITFYKVKKIRTKSALDDWGVRVNDYVGFIDDYYEDKKRHLELLHLPNSQSHAYLNTEKSSIRDYIYSLTKDEHDENIL